MIKQALTTLIASSCVFAAAQNSDSKRVSAIWTAIDERISRQSDAWFKEGDFPRTVQLLRFHFGLNPGNYDIGTNLGFLLESIDEYDEALAVYIKLRVNSPDDPDNAWPEANFYFRKKAYAKIPPILEPTIKNHDPHANNYRTLAHAYERMNMLSDGKRVWELYLSKHPDDLAAKRNLDNLLKKLNGGKD